MSIRSAASCTHPLHDFVDPRGARIVRDEERFTAKPARTDMRRNRFDVRVRGRSVASAADPDGDGGIQAPPPSPGATASGIRALRARQQLDGDDALRVAEDALRPFPHASAHIPMGTMSS